MNLLLWDVCFCGSLPKKSMAIKQRLKGIHFGLICSSLEQKHFKTSITVTNVYNSEEQIHLQGTRSVSILY